MTVMKLHRCRFVHYLPSNVLQISSFQTKFAVLRESGVIEIYALNPQIHLLQVLFTVNTEQILLSKSTVITACLDGQVKIYCLITGNLLQTYYSSGGAIWALQSNPENNILALGTESGQIHLLTPSLEYLSTLNLQSQTRITCLAFHPNKPIIAAGSVDGKVRVIHMDTQKVIQTLVLTRTDTIIWSILFTTGGTLVSGDSMGKVIFWNGKTGTVIKIFKHQADVLTMCLWQGKVVSSGVDRQIQVYEENDGTWIQTSKRKFHSHDIRTLSTISSTLISGGIGQIIASESSSPNLYRFGLLPFRSILSFGNRLVSARFEDCIKVFGIGEGYKHLITININLPRLHCLSPEGDTLIVYNSTGLKLFKLGYEPVEVLLEKSVEIDGVWEMKFYSGMVLLGLTGAIGLLDLASGEVEVISLRTEAMVNRIAVSNGVVACGDVQGRLMSFNLETKTVGPSLPKYNLTSIQFIPGTSDLVITTVSNEIFILNASKNVLHPWSAKNSSNIPQRFLDRKDIIKGVTFTERGMVIYGYSFLYHIDLSEDIDSNWVLETKYQAILDVQIDNGEMTVVERPVLQVLSEIGDAVGKKKYGE